MSLMSEVRLASINKSLNKITGLFTDQAVTFLENERGKLPEMDKEEFLNGVFENGGGFSEREKRLLDIILTNQSEFSVQEWPLLASFSDHLQGKLNEIEGDLFELESCDVFDVDEFIKTLTINAESLSAHERKNRFALSLFNVSYKRDLYDRLSLFSYDRHSLERMTSLFTEGALSFLEDKQKELPEDGKIVDIDALLNESFTNGGGFSEQEKELLRIILKDVNDDYWLKELPLAGLSQYLQTILDVVDDNFVEIGGCPKDFIGNVSVNGEMLHKNDSKIDLATSLFYRTYDRYFDIKFAKEVDDLFSDEAKIYLESKLEELKPVGGKIEDIAAFLDERFSNGKGFSQSEKDLLRVLLRLDDAEVEEKLGEQEVEEEMDRAEESVLYALTEMPFQSLLEYVREIMKSSTDTCVWPINLDCFLHQVGLIENNVAQRVILSLLSTFDEWFSVTFTGGESEDGWFAPENKPRIIIRCLAEVTGETTLLNIVSKIKLFSGEPAVEFYNHENVNEKYAVDQKYPMVKVKLNPSIKFDCIDENLRLDCCLGDIIDSNQEGIGIYNYLKQIYLKSAHIDVKVCGIKNLLVQNEENLQDVNELILPFGVRPKEKAEFFIGSKEVLCKQWDNVYVNVEWKDRPLDFKSFYSDYFLDEEARIDDEDFKIESAVLQNGIWKKWKIRNSEINQKRLFIDKDKLQDCSSVDHERLEVNGYHYNRFDFEEDLVSDQKIFDDSLLQPKGVNSREAFLRLTLVGSSFLHDEYPFVLARNLIKLAGLIDPKDVPTLKDEITNAHDELTKKDDEKEILPVIDFAPDNPDGTQGELLDSYIKQIKTELESIEDTLDIETQNTSSLNNAIEHLNDARAKLEPLIQTTGSLKSAEGKIDDAKGKLSEDTENALGFLASARSKLEQARDELDDGIPAIDPSDPKDGIEELAFAISKLDEALDIVEPGGNPAATDRMLESILKIQADVGTAISILQGSSPDLAEVERLLDIESNPHIQGIIDDIGDPSNPSEGTLLLLLSAAKEAIQRGDTHVDASLNNITNTADGAIKHIDDADDKIDKSLLDLDSTTGALKHTAEVEQGIKDSLEQIGNPSSTSPLTPATGAYEDIEAAMAAFSNVQSIIASIKLKLNGPDEQPADKLEGVIPKLRSVVKSLKIAFQIVDKVGDLVGIPNEPYTPLLKSISIDYEAHSGENDIALIHLYPFENSSRREDIELQPTLFPMFEDEGTLFIGLNNLRPGSNLRLLFQLAEATADSESDRAEIEWAYLSNNEWEPLRTGFEIISDETNELTRSGIVKLSLPRDITKEGNTLMPPVGEEGDEKHVYWLKVSSRCNTAGVAETINIHTQAALATYEVVEGADLKRVEPGLPPEQLSKPLEPDFNIKKVLQPYPAFGGKAPEQESLLYKRVSEHLRHKGRSINTFDIEHLVLEAFPSIFKCKCISHTLGLSANQFRRDLEVAPGFVVVAVIPDLTKLKAGDGLEPKAPVSMLEEIKAYLKKRMSPFARLRVMNPRYEKIKVDTTVRIKPGRDETFYLNQLKQDLTHFLAPWHLGYSDKLSFGQSVTYSEVIGFMENLDYIDFIDDLKLFDPLSSGKDDDPLKVILPATARSILTGGKICTHKNAVECDPPDSEEPGRKPHGDVSKKTHLFRSIEEKLEDG